MPVWNDLFSDCMYPGGTEAGRHFYEYYHDVPGQNFKINDFVTLNWGMDPMYPPSETNCYVWEAKSKPYFPIDHRGLGNYCWYGPTPPLGNPGTDAVQRMQYGADRRPECLWQIDSEVRDLQRNGSCASPYFMHNFHFTDHIQYFFRYQQATGQQPYIRFQGDDDCWIFMNGEMILDIGGVDWCIDVQMQMVGTVLRTMYSTNPDCRLSPERRPPVNFERALPAYVDGANYRIDIFHAQRKVECSHLQLCLGNMFPACPTAGAVCAPPLANGCGAFVCDANYQCSPVARNNSNPCVAMATDPAPPICQRYQCLNGSCMIGPDLTLVGKKCEPPPGTLKHSCMQWICGQNGTCIEVPSEEFMNRTCIPAPGQSVTPPECQEYICDGTGECVAIPDVEAIGQICTGPASIQCNKYICVANGTCSQVPDSGSAGQLCIPDKGFLVPPCMTYGCRPDGSCGLIVDTDATSQPCLLDGFVPSTCMPTPICLPNGTCAIVPSPLAIGQPCVPTDGSGDVPCQQHVCAADGSCISVPDQDAIGQRVSCIPVGVDLTDLPPCQHYICTEDGTCAISMDASQVGSVCSPDDGALIENCARFVCTDSGKCERSTDAEVGEFCTPAAGAPQPNCEAFVCVQLNDAGDVDCQPRPSNFTYGQPCTPEGEANPCLSYVCALDGSCAASALVDAPCARPSNLEGVDNGCLVYKCTPAGTCEGAPTIETENNVCTPGPHQTANDCFHWICGSDGTCNTRVLRPDMEDPSLPGARRIPCVPDIPNYNSTSDPCSNWFCLGNGTCGRFDTILTNTTACAFIPSKGSKGKAGVIVGVVVAAAAVAAVIAAGVIAYKALAGPGAGPGAAGGNPGAAADAFANPLFHEKVVRQNQLAE